MDILDSVRGGLRVRSLINSPRRLLHMTGLAWEKDSNVHFPLYRPIPLAPTPPKGSVPENTCMAVSFTVHPPQETDPRTCSTVAVEEENRYKANGCSRESIKLIASSTPSALIMGRIGPNI